MILGIGIDLVSISKLGKSLGSEAFKRKVFTDAEIAVCEGVVNSAERYAGKFAAKEAFMKAIRKGIRQEIWFSQIEVLNQDTGAPYVNLSGEARRTLESQGGKQVHLSISHTDGMAVAIVILETE